jgi:integrase
MKDGLQRRGSRWAYVVELAPDPTTRKRKQKWVGGFRTRAEAKAARDKALGELVTGAYVAPTRQTVAEFLDEWLDARASSLAESTEASYRRNVANHVIPYIGSARLFAVDAGTLNTLYGELLARGGRGRLAGRGLSPRTVRYVHTIVRAALADAVKWGRLGRNPADAASPPKGRSVAPPEIQTWSAETLSAFLTRSSSDDDRYFPLWHLLAMTGARRGEMLGLRWADVDFDGHRLSIRQTVVNVKNVATLSVPKTPESKRPIAIDQRTVAVLVAWRRVQAAERLLIGPGYRDHDLVFAKPTGEPLHPERVSREFDRRITRWSFPRITVHGLRHTWATLALAAGVHPRVVQERLGHTMVTTTLQIYSHTTPVLHADAADTVAGAVFGDSPR